LQKSTEAADTTFEILGGQPSENHSDKMTVDYYYYYYYTCLTAFSRTTWVGLHHNGKPFWILLEQEMMGWQWHQLDQMQIICTSLQTDNHASTSPVSLYRQDALPAAEPKASKH